MTVPPVREGAGAGREGGGARGRPGGGGGGGVERAPQLVKDVN